MSCAGVVLTGGASRRMGRDKAALAAAGPEPTLARRTARILLEHTSPCAELGPGTSGLPPLPDPGEGPLRALAAAAAWWDALPADGHVVVVATDLPRLTGGIVAWLAAHPSPAAVVPVDGGRPQPLCARYPVAVLRSLARAPLSGRGLQAWLHGVDVHYANPDEWRPPAGDPLALRDADTPEDLAALSTLSGPAGPASTSPALTAPEPHAVVADTCAGR